MRSDIINMMYFWFNEVNLMILMIVMSFLYLWRFEHSLNVWKETSTQYYLWAELLSLMISYDHLRRLVSEYKIQVSWLCRIHFLQWSWMITNDHVGQYSLITIRPQHSHFKDESSPKVTTCLILLSCTISSLSLSLSLGGGADGRNAGLQW